MDLVAALNGGIAKWEGRGLQNRYERVRLPLPPQIGAFGSFLSENSPAFQRWGIPVGKESEVPSGTAEPYLFDRAPVVPKGTQCLCGAMTQR